METLKRVADLFGYNFGMEEEGKRKVVALDGLYRRKIWEDCIFQSCDDEDVGNLLNDWLDGELTGDRDVELQLGILLAARGQLVFEKALAIFQRGKWNGFNPRQIFLSFICNLPDYPNVFRRLLETMPCDFRDGLFVSAWTAARADIDRILIDAFTRWHCAGDWEPAGTAEDGWLEAFLKRWVANYEIKDLEGPLRAYFDVC